MSKKYEISTEAQVLLKLLRIALGTEPMAAEGRRQDDGTSMTAGGKPAAEEATPAQKGSTPVEPFPQGIDWREVIRLSYEQKVSSLAVDGLKASGYDIRQLAGSADLQSAFASWFDDVKNSEESYAYYLTVLSTLCQIFSANGLKPVILKGYGLSRNYPVPSHRGAGDIDIFVIDQNGRLATERALDIIENQLKIQTKKVPHDYEFTFKGLEVELHYDATNPYFGTKQERYITSRLTEMLPQGIIPCPEIPGAYLPSADFNALYLIRHSFGHFYTASGNLRQCVDWLTFLRTHSGEIDWHKLGPELDRFNMKPFFDGFNTMLGRWLGLDTALCPISAPDPRTEQFILKDLHSPIKGGRHLHQRIRYHYGNRRKLKFITGKGWLYLLSGSIMTSVKHILNPGKPLY